MPFHWYDLLVVAGVALLVFGPKRLPEMGSAVGKTFREFQKSLREITGEAPTTPEPPTPAPALPALLLPAASAVAVPSSVTDRPGEPITVNAGPSATLEEAAEAAGGQELR